MNYFCIFFFKNLHISFFYSTFAVAKAIERVWLTTCVWLHSVFIVAIQRHRGKAKRMSYVKSGV